MLYMFCLILYSTWYEFCFAICAERKFKHLSKKRRLLRETMHQRLESAQFVASCLANSQWQEIASIRSDDTGSFCAGQLEETHL